MSKENKTLDKKQNGNDFIADVSGITFTNEELQTIKIDILHICDKISLSEIDVHRRNLILNKLKILLGDEYYC